MQGWSRKRMPGYQKAKATSHVCSLWCSGTQAGSHTHTIAHTCTHTITHNHAPVAHIHTQSLSNTHTMPMHLTAAHSRGEEGACVCVCKRELAKAPALRRVAIVKAGNSSVPCTYRGTRRPRGLRILTALSIYFMHAFEI